MVEMAVRREYVCLALHHAAIQAIHRNYTGSFVRRELKPKESD